MTRHFNVAIVGAGHGGAQAAIALRQNGFAGSIGLIGDEPDPPYERPPLSKGYLAKDKSFDRILIHPADFWNAKDVALILATRIAAVDAEAHVLTTASGESAVILDNIKVSPTQLADTNRPLAASSDGRRTTT